MNERGNRPPFDDEDTDEITYGEFPDAEAYLWPDDEEDAIELEDLDAGADDAAREDLFAAIASLDDEADAPPLAPVPAADALPVPQPLPLPLPDDEPAEDQPVAPVAAAAASIPGTEMIYRVVLTLPLELSEQIAALRAEAGIEGLPPPGIELTPPFHTGDPEAVEATLEAWAQDTLPLQPEITGVVARVIGTQQYEAALAVEPGADLVDVSEDLMTRLEDLIVLPGELDPAPGRILVGGAVEAAAYPRLIARLQREIDLIGWQAESAMLIRRPAGSDTAEWEVVTLVA